MMAEITASLILKRGGQGSPEGAVFLQKYAVTVEERGRGEERERKRDILCFYVNTIYDMILCVILCWYYGM